MRRPELDSDSSDIGVEVELVRARTADDVEWQISEPAHIIRVGRRGTAEGKEVTVESGGGQTVTSLRSCVWVVPADDRSFAIARHTRLFEYFQLTVAPALIGPEGLRQVVGRRDPVLRGFLERVSSLSKRDDTVARLLRDPLFDSTRLHVLDAYGMPRRRRQRSRCLDRVTRERIAARMHDGLDREISLAALADLAEMSVPSFRRAFSTEYGTTPHQYLLDLRTRRAKNLLATTTMSVADISDLTGFSSPSRLATTFKNRVGTSPTEFRATRR